MRLGASYTGEDGSMNLGLKGKVALVAAASKGLGKAAAWALAQEGAQVVIAARGEAELRAAEQEIRQGTGGQVRAVRADVSVAADIEALTQAAMSAFGRVDILVNNAGGPRPGVFTDMTDEDWLGAINLNLMSAIRLTRLVLPGMRARRWGRIINITSFLVKQPSATLILSNAARSAVVAMAKTLAGQVAAEGITVNNVCPGYTLTERMRNLAVANARTEHNSAEEIMAQWEALIPMHRLGQPEELAALIAFLASEQAAYLTGATIQVDGGLIQSLL
jgi:3-oxoacyl-[acyl-carrier protein] reductase